MFFARQRNERPSLWFTIIWFLGPYTFDFPSSTSFRMFLKSRGSKTHQSTPSDIEYYQYMNFIIGDLPSTPCFKMRKKIFVLSKRCQVLFTFHHFTCGLIFWIQCLCPRDKKRGQEWQFTLARIIILSQHDCGREMDRNWLTCINETLSPTTEVSPITTPVPWSNRIASPILAAGQSRLGREVTFYKQYYTRIVIAQHECKKSKERKHTSNFVRKQS